MKLHRSGDSSSSSKGAKVQGSARRLGADGRQVDQPQVLRCRMAQRLEGADGRQVDQPQVLRCWE